MKNIYSQSYIHKHHDVDWDIPGILYHATYAKYIPSIKLHGLRPTGNKCNWEGCDPGVYLAQDAWQAESFAEDADWGFEQGHLTEEDFDNIVVLQIDVNQLESSMLSVDPHCMGNFDEGAPSGCKTLLYRDVIPASAIINL